MKKKNKQTNKETNNGMAHCSFQELKRIIVVTRNLPYPSCSLQVVKKRKEKREIAHFSKCPCTE